MKWLVWTRFSTASPPGAPFRRAEYLRCGRSGSVPRSAALTGPRGATRRFDCAPGRAVPAVPATLAQQLNQHLWEVVKVHEDALVLLEQVEVVLGNVHGEQEAEVRVASHLHMLDLAALATRLLRKRLAGSTRGRPLRRSGRGGPRPAAAAAHLGPQQNAHNQILRPRLPPRKLNIHWQHLVERWVRPVELRHGRE